ncbi:MAG: hypothetical protein LBL26_05510 [Peptococcaceae bacterium]|nr:hypothetical protein [Peptococcaceae bacterium]
MAMTLRASLSNPGRPDAAPVSEMKALDTEREARELIQNGKGVVTPYGVVYDNGMELAQFYGGKEFPAYLYDQCVLAVEAKKTSDPEAESTWLYLPVPEVCVERALIRGGLRDCDELRLDMEVIDVSSDLFHWVDPASETVAELNGAAQAIQALGDEDLTKLCAVVEYAKPGSAKALKNLALNIGLFDFYPDVFTAKEYGRYTVTQSGHFRYDADLDAFYDFEGYGRRRLDHEQGAFVSAGYIRRKGFVSIEEAMADIWSGRAGQESPDKEPGPNMRMGGP